MRVVIFCHSLISDWNLLDAPSAASAIADHGRWTLLGRHTCMHRVDELLAIVERTSR